MPRRFVLALALTWLAPCSAVAGTGADIARQSLEGGHFETGEVALSTRIAADPADNEARFGLGMIRFAQALQHFGQRQYRFGLRVPSNNIVVPILRLPVPNNPAPEALTYETQRENLKALLDDFSKVESALAPMSDAPTKIVIDLDAIKFDFRDDGKPDASETLGAILMALLTPGRRAATAEPDVFKVKFDNGDAYWLRGYCHLLSATLEFVLAYDWRNTFERAGQIFYPRVQPAPFGERHPMAKQNNDWFGDPGQVADFVTAIHEIRWPLSDPARLRAAHAHLVQVVAMSRATWKSVLAETDDDREWIPGPRQKNGVLTSMPVTQEQVDAWLRALDELDAVLEGRKLLAHWRFVQGFNLKRVFLEPRDFDLMLWVTGVGAVPYLEDGEMLTSVDWDQWNKVFMGNFWGYAVWFN